MFEPPASPPSPDEGLAIHRRLLDGDPVAPSDLAGAYLDDLARYLTHRNPSIDPALCDTAAEDAILALIKNPLSYAPEKLSLGAYLRMSAQGDLKNALAREGRHTGRTVPFDVVEQSGRAGKELQEEDPALMIERQETWNEKQSGWLNVLRVHGRHRFTPEEALVVELLLAGVRETGEFARALGIEHLPVAQQRREVKRAKDRIKKRIHRERQL